jgi:hypothetical protein
VDRVRPAVLHITAGLLSLDEQSLDEQSLDEHLKSARNDRNRAATVKTPAIGVGKLARIPKRLVAEERT